MPELDAVLRIQMEKTEVLQRKSNRVIQYVFHNNEQGPLPRLACGL
jgi:hypothetical protein